MSSLKKNIGKIGCWLSFFIYCVLFSPNQPCSQGAQKETESAANGHFQEDEA